MDEIETLIQLRAEMREANSNIDSIKDNKRSTNKRISEIESIINYFYSLSDNVTFYNNDLSNLENSIDVAVLSESRASRIEISNIKEKDCHSDAKISSAISDLKNEVTNLRSRIASADSEVDALKRRINSLEEKEQAIIYERMNEAMQKGWY